jgi:hypothetical protein
MLESFSSLLGEFAIGKLREYLVERKIIRHISLPWLRATYHRHGGVRHFLAAYDCDRQILEMEKRRPKDLNPRLDSVTTEKMCRLKRETVKVNEALA